MPILTAIIVVVAIGLVCAVLLVVASKFLSVPTDDRVEKVRDLLPGANCGACGYAGCDDYAKAIVKDGAEPNLCVPGGPETSKKIAEVMGVDAGETVPMKAIVRCIGTCEHCGDVENYNGPKTCAACASIYEGKKGCGYGCIGFGDCVAACKFDAIHIEDNIAVVDPEACTGCGACAKACPHSVITLVPKTSRAYVRCSSHNKGAVVRKVCSAGCIGCMMCTKVCPTGAISVTNFLASIDPEKCTNCGACAEKCPVKVIKFE